MLLAINNKPNNIDVTQHNKDKKKTYIHKQITPSPQKKHPLEVRKYITQLNASKIQNYTTDSESTAVFYYSYSIIVCMYVLVMSVQN